MSCFKQLFESHLLACKLRTLVKPLIQHALFCRVCNRSFYIISVKATAFNFFFLDNSLTTQRNNYKIAEPQVPEKISGKTVIYIMYFLPQDAKSKIACLSL